MSLELFIAWRYIKARRKGVFTLLTTFIAIGGITLGVAALIITLAVMSGFHKDIKEKILGFQPHLIILNNDRSPIYNPDVLQNKIKNVKSIKAVAPFVYGQAILKNKQFTAGALIKGINWKEENKLIDFKKNIVDPKIVEKGLGNSQIILGKELANNLGLTKDNDVVIMTPGQIGVIPKMKKFKVIGTFYSGMYEYDSNLALVSLKSGQELFGLGNAVTGIGATVDNWDKAHIFEKYLQQILPYSYYVRSWQRLNKNLFSALKLEKIMMFIILTLIILVAAFNIISNLILLSIEKSKEIGILSAIGVLRHQIGKIFFFEGLIIGLSGIIFGVVLGLSLSLILKKYQFIHLPGDIYYLDTLPVNVATGDVLSVIAATFLITLLAVLYPAFQATKLDPLEIIRYG